MKHLIDYIKRFLTTSLLIKFLLLIFICLVIGIIYLESQDPKGIPINEIENLSLNDPLKIENVSLKLTYISDTFSILILKQNKYEITGTMQENASFISTELKYTIIGKVSKYRGEKQIDIYQIKEFRE